LEEILHYGSQSGMCSSRLSILYHIVIKSGHIDISFFTTLPGIVSLHPGLYPPPPPTRFPFVPFGDDIKSGK